jgi:hypothetical protein
MKEMLRKTRHLFPDELWSPLAVVAVPAFVFDENHNPVLTKNELRVYALLCEKAEDRHNNCSVELSISDVQVLLGIAKRSSAVEARDGLERKNFIKRIARTGNLAPLYLLTNPKTGEPFAVQNSDQRLFQSLRSRLRHSGVGYFNVPRFAVVNIKEVSSAAFSAFIAVARYMNLLQERDGEIRASILCSMAGLDRKTLNKSVASLNHHWLTIGFTDTAFRTLLVELIDHSSRKSLTQFARKQLELDDAEREQRMREGRTHSPEALLAFAMWAIGSRDARHTSGADFMFRCPACHNGKTHRPKFSVNVFMGTHGAYFCHDCKIGGGLVRLATENVGLFDALKKLQNIHQTEPDLMKIASKLLQGYTERGFSQRAS